MPCNMEHYDHFTFPLRMFLALQLLIDELCHNYEVTSTSCSLKSNVVLRTQSLSLFNVTCP
jgi:hypothetical protein